MAMTARKYVTRGALVASLALAVMGASGAVAAAGPAPQEGTHAGSGTGAVTASVISPGSAKPVVNSLSRQTARVRSSTAYSGTRLTVDPTLQFQKVKGFGASITDASAYDLMLLSKQDRDETMQKLFDPAKGAGLSLLRQPIGASDLATKMYSYDDMAKGRKDYALKHFSIEHDKAQIIPLVKQAQKLNPQMSIVASPWSPPGWMKTTDSMIDGKLIDSPRIYSAYANYLVKFLDSYQRAGIKVDYITIQNEPQALDRYDYPGTNMNVTQEAKVIEKLGPAIKRAGLRTKILGFDHNWAQSAEDTARLEQANGDPEVNYPYKLLQTKAAKWIDGTAYHCYVGEPSAQSSLKTMYPNKSMLETECEGLNIDQSIGTMQNWGESLTAWNIALDQNHGPFLGKASEPDVGGCKTCSGLVTVNSESKKVTYNPRYYMLAQFSQFVKPGATRVMSNTQSNDKDHESVLDSVAFRNTDGSTAVVVHNTADSTEQFQVDTGGSSFRTTLPADGVATYSWE